MIKYRLALDFDNYTQEAILAELARLRARYPIIEFELWLSSPGCYHIKSSTLLTWPEAEDVLDFSRCSEAYKKRCKECKTFSIRTSSKQLYKPDGHVEERQAPRLIEGV
jgi:hypothetical protein